MTVTLPGHLLDEVKELLGGRGLATQDWVVAEMTELETDPDAALKRLQKHWPAPLRRGRPPAGETRSDGDAAKGSLTVRPPAELAASALGELQARELVTRAWMEAAMVELTSDPDRVLKRLNKHWPVPRRVGNRIGPTPPVIRGRVIVKAPKDQLDAATALLTDRGKDIDEWAVAAVAELAAEPDATLARLQRYWPAPKRSPGRPPSPDRKRTTAAMGGGRLVLTVPKMVLAKVHDVLESRGLAARPWVVAAMSALIADPDRTLRRLRAATPPESEPAVAEGQLTVRLPNNLLNATTDMLNSHDMDVGEWAASAMGELIADADKALQPLTGHWPPAQGR
jgi:hypothetical protein